MLVKKKAIGTIGRMFGSTLSAGWVDCFVDMVQFSTESLIKDPATEYIKYSKADVSWHELGRQQLVESAEGEWLLQLDTDHRFSPDILVRMLYLMDKHKIDVLSALYTYKKPPHAPVAGHLVPIEGGQEGQTQLVGLETWDEKAEIVPVDVVGAGCLLVKNSVYRRLNEEFKCSPFQIIQGLSEDYSFCARCKKLGIQVYLAPQIECHHEITMCLSVQDYLRQRKINDYRSN